MGARLTRTFARAHAVRLIAALFALYVLWGSNYVGIKLGLETLPPFSLLALRWGVAGALLFAVAATRGGAAADPLGPRQWLATLTLGIVLLGAGNGALFFSEQYISSGLAALLVGTVPLFAAIFAALIDRRAVTWPTALGLVLGIVGLAVLLDPHGAPRNAWIAIAVSLAGSLSWSFGSVIARRLPTPKRPLVSAAMQMLWVGVIFSIVAAFAHEWPATLQVVMRPWAPSFLLTYLWLVLCAGLAGYIAYLWLLSHASLTLANSYAFVNPVVAVALGIVLLGEPFTTRVVAGTAIVVAAVTLIVVKPRPAPIAR